MRLLHIIAYTCLVGKKMLYHDGFNLQILLILNY